MIGSLTFNTGTALAQDTPSGETRPGFLDNLVFGGYLRNESAYRVVRPTAFDKILNIVQLQGQYRFNSSLSITGRIRGYYDAVYDLENIDTISPRKGPDTILTENVTGAQIDALTVENPRHVEYDRLRYGLELKELYLDAALKRADVRIGRQIVRWGVVEGARVTDEINPLDFTELILRDVDDRYIPLLMVKGDYYLGRNTFELIWIPEIRGHRPAPQGSEWEQFRFLPGLIQPEDAWKDFPNHLNNSEIAVKYSRVFTSSEFSLSYFYTWDDFPASFREITRTGFGTQTDLAFSPSYARLRIYGATYSRSFEGFILNAEFAYTNGKIFGARLLQDSTALGELKRDFVKYAVGLDFKLFGVELSPAFIQEMILHYDDSIIRDRTDTIGALFARREILHNLVTGQILILYFANEQDWLIRPRVNYSLTDRVRIGVGADIFEGTIGSDVPGEFHFIGFFANNDRVYFDVTYSF
jgi:hypothetical protein